MGRNFDRKNPMGMKIYKKINFKNDPKQNKQQ